ncbi:MAG: CPXCG motif-containing cysteine-rich protein [Amphritea sp.]
MQSLEYLEIQCPYCGESFDVEIDCTAGSQNYIEDCQVCCRPITLLVDLDNDQPKVTAQQENDV